MFMGDSLIVALWIVPVVVFIITPLITLLIYSLGLFNPLFKDRKEDSQPITKETQAAIEGMPALNTSSGK